MINNNNIKYLTVNIQSLLSKKILKFFILLKQTPWYRLMPFNPNTDINNNYYNYCGL